MFFRICTDWRNVAEIKTRDVHETIASRVYLHGVRLSLKGQFDWSNFFRVPHHDAELQRGQNNVVDTYTAKAKKHKNSGEPRSATCSEWNSIHPPNEH